MYEKVADKSKLPTLYRYLSEQYVNRFFEDGALRLSTLYGARAVCSILVPQSGLAIQICR